ncbi:MAG TPA: S8 family serine peptidase [Burkholderiales bacterium]|nr:S8 family serine peptidase [Burkholderiales bacterium]
MRGVALAALQALWLSALSAWTLAAEAPIDAPSLLRQAIAAVCANPHADGRALAPLFGAERLLDERALSPGGELGWQRRYALPGGAALAVTRVAPGKRLREVRAIYEAPAGKTTRPELFAIAGPDCEIHHGRKVEYSSAGRALAIGFLYADLSPSGAGELLDAPVPAAADPGGVVVAHVDSGVNYLLPGLASRLARDAHGAALGYDWWDMDARPFDQDPSRSAFFPQRHGTRTASLLLQEAPVARLVPYRYPRTDMARMASLVEAAAKAGARIVTLAMGSNDRTAWEAYAEAVRRHPEMLFIVSAGNDGRDLDREPVYPAALALANQLTVTSSEDDGTLASGSNWGRRTVDLLVPAENVLVTAFDGRRIFASGASYAAARVGALAACLLAAHPDWRAGELRKAILALSRPAGAEAWSGHGFLPDPLARERGACPPAQTSASVGWSEVLHAADLTPGASNGPAPSMAMEISIVAVEGAGWERPAIRAMLRSAAAILGQCAIELRKASVHQLLGPERMQYFTAETAQALVAARDFPRPAAYLVADTRRAVPFDAEAFAPANAAATPSLADTVWIVRRTPNPGIALAHELVHVLTDSGEHASLAGNLMRDETAPENTGLTPQQCRRIRETGLARGLLAASK